MDGNIIDNDKCHRYDKGRMENKNVQTDQWNDFKPVGVLRTTSVVQMGGRACRSPRPALRDWIVLRQRTSPPTRLSSETFSTATTITPKRAPRDRSSKRHSGTHKLFEMEPGGHRWAICVALGKQLGRVWACGTDCSDSHYRNISITGFHGSVLSEVLFEVLVAYCVSYISMELQLEVVFPLGVCTYISFWNIIVCASRCMVWLALCYIKL